MKPTSVSCAAISDDSNNDAPRREPEYEMDVGCSVWRGLRRRCCQFFQFFKVRFSCTTLKDAQQSSVRASAADFRSLFDSY